MAETLSNMLVLGTPMPAFALTDVVTGRTRSEHEVAGERGTLVMFICNHCPFVKHVLPELDRLMADYGARGIGIVAINSNDLASYPQDGPGPMKQLAVARGWTIPFLFDADQSAARAYRAACTPDFFLFDGGRRLVYRGRLDDSRPNSDAPLTGRDLRAALDAVLAARMPALDQKPSIGCGIKWKAGAVSA
jgi:thiol-disulfide isomerase/thioredoxin